VQHAKQMLSDSKLPLADVVACVGFQTQARFTGVFRRYGGVTPRAYRLGNRASDPRVDFFASAHPEPLAARI
jgi:AraC-like DNA-binding protein